MNLYDYIIIGAGSAGCVLAEGLSRSGKYSVLLLESGPEDKSPLIQMPRGIGKLLAPPNPYIWHYRATMKKDKADEDWLKGKTLGGSSAINGMVWMRGQPSEYDDWEAAGCTGWGWNNVGRCFKTMENHQLGEAEWRGAKGPLKITLHPADNPIYDYIFDACIASGLPQVEDVNEVHPDGGIGYVPRNIWNGQRQSAAKVYLHPSRSRKNLTVRTNAHVTKILFDGVRATGVKLSIENGESEIFANKEIILSAGAVQTPKLLQLSGVGPGALLKKHGIPLVLDVPEVGENLLEHRCIMMSVRIREGSMNQEFSGLRLMKNMLSYVFKKSGPMTTAAHEICGLLKTRPEYDRPDAELGIGLYSITQDDKGKIIVEKEPGMTWVAYVTRPESRGSSHISSADPAAAPQINANYLATENDRKRSIDLIKMMRKILSQDALKNYVIDEISPGPQAESDDELVEAYLQHGSTAFHVSGTCRMGADANSVVDPQLRIRGLQGLRVADTSIMPSLISGNTNGPAMVIGMRAAEIILSEQDD